VIDDSSARESARLREFPTRSRPRSLARCRFLAPFGADWAPRGRVQRNGSLSRAHSTARRDVRRRRRIRGERGWRLRLAPAPRLARGACAIRSADARRYPPATSPRVNECETSLGLLARRGSPRRRGRAGTKAPYRGRAAVARVASWRLHRARSARTSAGPAARRPPPRSRTRSRRPRFRTRRRKGTSGSPRRPRRPRARPGDGGRGRNAGRSGIPTRTPTRTRRRAREATIRGRPRVPPRRTRPRATRIVRSF
jgi:hypothetical protein